jgi:hypothetical protein
MLEGPLSFFFFHFSFHVAPHLILVGTDKLRTKLTRNAKTIKPGRRSEPEKKRSLIAITKYRVLESLNPLALEFCLWRSFTTTAASGAATAAAGFTTDDDHVYVFGSEHAVSSVDGCPPRMAKRTEGGPCLDGRIVFSRARLHGIPRPERCQRDPRSLGVLQQ